MTERPDPSGAQTSGAPVRQMATSWRPMTSGFTAAIPAAITLARAGKSVAWTELQTWKVATAASAALPAWTMEKMSPPR